MGIVYINKFGTLGAGNGQLDYPLGVCADSLYIYVCDANNFRVHIFDKVTHAYVGKFGSVDPGDGNFDGLASVAVNASFIFTFSASATIPKMQKFNLASPYAFVSKIQGAGSGDGQFSASSSANLDIDASYIYVADKGNHRIQKFNIGTNAFVSKYGTFGTGDANFKYPSGIAVDSSYIYIVDHDNSRVKIHDKATYAFVAAFGSIGDGDGQFRIMQGIDVDGSFIYVADKPTGSGGRIQIFDIATRAFVEGYTASLGSGDGQLNLGTILTGQIIHVSGSTIYISDTGNNRIQLFSRETPPADPTLLTASCSTGIGESTLANAPTTQFTADVTSGLAPLTVNFTDTSGQTPTSWLWEIGGVTYTSQNVTHLFTTAGIYPVRLTATNADGSRSYQMTIIATDTPVVSPPGDGTVTPGGTPGNELIQSLYGQIGYYVVDTDGHQIGIHDANGVLLKSFGGLGTTAGKFFNPTTCSIVNGRQLIDRAQVPEE